MSLRLGLLSTIAALGVGLVAERSAEAATVKAVPGGLIITPDASIARPGDAGVRAHTTFKLFAPKGFLGNDSAPSSDWETPASLACLYGLTKKVTGCNPEKLTTVATTGSKVVAIVDAYDDPTAQNDLSVYSQQYGLPPITDDNFSVVYGSGSKPAQDSTGGWELEEALDIEMAHALAPNAKVVLVEAASNSISDLLQAEKVAGKLVAAAGGGEVSNSWCGSETADETSDDKYFAAAKVVFFAAAGDDNDVCFPSVLTDVASVGGTSISRDPNGNFENQSAWTSSGGGASQYVARPSYQNAVKNKVGSTRGTPDVALVSDAVWVYDTTPYEGSAPDWVVVLGTSVATPAIAAITNSVGSFAATTAAELTVEYKNRGNKADWTDITLGACRNGSLTLKGYDFCTGIGTALGFGGK